MDNQPCSTSGCKTGTPQELFKHPLVQALLSAIPAPTLQTDFKLDFKIAKSFKEKGRFIIAGYASVEVIDSQNEMIPIPVLKDAWNRFKKNDEFQISTLMHTNIPVAKILDDFTDSKGQVWKSEVDENGLFVVAEVRDDIEKGKQTQELIKAGKLTGFSLGGEALASSPVCEGKCYTRIEKMDLHEIAIVDSPANQPSVFTIVKADKLRKMGELTDSLPNLIISSEVAVLAGSTAELGKGHDFDVLIRATEGSFVSRAIQTRIHNELRKSGRLDLWEGLQFIHEPEGLGPFTDNVPLYDLVLLRSPVEKKNMVISKKLGKDAIKVKIDELGKKRTVITDKLWGKTVPPEPLSNEAKQRIEERRRLLSSELDGYQKALGEAILGENTEKSKELLEKIVTSRKEDQELGYKVYGGPSLPVELTVDERESLQSQLTSVDVELSGYSSAYSQIIFEENDHSLEKIDLAFRKLDGVIQKRGLEKMDLSILVMDRFVQHITR